MRREVRQCERQRIKITMKEKRGREREMNFFPLQKYLNYIF